MINGNKYCSLVKAAYAFVIPDGYISLFDLPNEFGWVLQDVITKEIIITVRGTETLTDWFTDGAFKLIDTPYGSMHNGFWTNADDMFMPIYMLLNTYFAENPNTDIKVTLAGHSLGAAIVTVLALRLQEYVIDVYTYASPKVGTKLLAYLYKEQVKGKTYRYWNKLDVVPMGPEGFGYQHVCEGIEMDDCIFGDILYNHSIDTYLRNIC